ncbi:MAG: hypothetical protein LBL00_08795 [Endomicrobium sp.]|jgi:hypothetical protein|nr:hypothetical protein [Endomicrobium sp.]
MNKLNKAVVFIYSAIVIFIKCLIFPAVLFGVLLRIPFAIYFFDDTNEGMSAMLEFVKQYFKR